MAAALVVGSVEAKPKKDKKGKNAPVVEAPLFTNNVDSMSYAFGVNLGIDFAKNLKSIPGGKINLDLLLKGFGTSLKGDSTLMTQEAAQAYFQNYIKTAEEVEAKQKKAEGEKFLAENAKRPEVQTTASGLQYEVLVPADGPKPMATSEVRAHYEGTLLDGTKFDSSYDRGEPISFPLNRVIPGWTEGVQLMSPGAKYKFYIPYNLGYGERGAGNGQIPPYATLVFVVELLEIK